MIVGVGVVVAVVAIVIEVAVVEAHTPATTHRTGTHILVNKYVGHVLAKRRIVGVGFGLCCRHYADNSCQDHQPCHGD